MSEFKRLIDNLGFLPEVENIKEYNFFQKVVFFSDRYRWYLRRPNLLLRRSTYVFGIGFSRTGTTSLTKALNILGYRAVHWDYTKTILSYDSNGRLFINCNRLLADFNAYTDLPIAKAYKLLDSAFPNSKFILTTRDPEAWFKSHCNWEAGLGLLYREYTSDRLNMDMLGSIEPEESKNTAAFRNHIESVKKYFLDRDADLLVIDITRGEGWEKLCPFLEKPILTCPFPKENVSNMELDGKDL